MHVLYLIDSLAPGGAERSLAALAPSLIARGVNLDVAYLKDVPGLQDELRRAGAELFCLDGRAHRMGWVRRSSQLVRRRKPDLIHTTLADSNLIGRVAGGVTRTPTVCSLVNVQYGPEHSGDPNVLPWRMRLIQSVNALSARAVTRFHAVTRDVAEVMGRRLFIPRAKIEVIPRGRDPQELGVRSDARRERMRQALGLFPEERVILAVARQEHQKRLDLLIEALPIVVREEPDARILIAGRSGSTTSRLTQLAKNLCLEDRVRFLGVRSDVPDLMCASDVVALPSRREGFPGVLVEAMALEAPIVATDLPGVREVVGGPEIAWLVSGESPSHFADAVVAALTDEPGVRERTRLGRERFLSEFTIDRVADKMVEFYDRALSSSRVDAR